MFNRLHHVRETFAAQFEQDGSQVVFRKNPKAAPVELTIAERDRLIAQFNRRVLWLVALTILLSIVVAVALGVADQYDVGSNELGAFLALMAVVAPVMTAGVWAWRAPARFVARRTPVGPARSANEVRKIAMAKITWGRLALAAILGVVAILRVDPSGDLTSITNLMWLALSACLIVGAAVQSIRKLRIERSTPPGSA